MNKLKSVWLKTPEALRATVVICAVLLVLGILLGNGTYHRIALRNVEKVTVSSCETTRTLSQAEARKLIRRYNTSICHLFKGFEADACDHVTIYLKDGTRIRLSETRMGGQIRVQESGKSSRFVISPMLDAYVAKLAP